MFGNDKRPPAAALAGGLVILLALAGCAGRMAPNEANTEANTVRASPPPSVSVPPAQPAATLKPDALDAPAATSVADAQRSAEIAEEMSGAAGGHEGHGGHGGHEGHGGGTYVHVDAGRAAAAQEETQEMSHDHHGHGMAEAAAEEATEVYVCPMHPEVTSSTPDKCSKCGMDLVQRRKE